MINDTITDIITYLQTNYGQIIEQELNDKEDIVKLTIYDPTLPIDTVFNQIKAFQDLCIIIGNEKINHQLVSIAYLFFTKTRAFTDALNSGMSKRNYRRQL